ncbi:Protein transport protein SEC31 B [Glycine max]|nr:Protein transport protein SEC31 B [Glycine max]
MLSHINRSFRDEWTMLCDILASKLMGASNTLAATLCYICVENIDKTIEIWSRSLSNEHEGKSYVDLLQDLMEKTIVVALAFGQKRFSASLCNLVEKHHNYLVIFICYIILIKNRSFVNHI